MSSRKINRRSDGSTEQAGFSDNKMGGLGPAEGGEAGFTETPKALQILVVLAVSIELRAVTNGD